MRKVLFSILVGAFLTTTAVVALYSKHAYSDRPTVGKYLQQRTAGR